MLLALRRAFPTVGSGILGSKFGCKASLNIFDFNHIYLKSQYKKFHTNASKLISYDK